MIAGVPYDAEVEYLKSTGTQWIDTGVTPQIQGVSKIDFKPVGYPSPVPWGCLNFTEVSDYGRYFSVNGYNGAVFRRNISTRYVVEVNGATKQVINNGAVWSDPNSSFLVAASGNCWLFGRSDTGALDHLLIYSASFTDSTGVLVRNFIPVRVGQVGYMYDRVTRKLFSNQGTGAFTIGPDVAKPVMGVWRYA